MKIQYLMLALAVTASNFNCTDNQSDPLISALNNLCNCQNSQGKTLNTMTRDFLGSNIYSSSPNAESFSDAINTLDPALRENWFASVNSNFLSDAKYMGCAQRNIPMIVQKLENQSDSSRYQTIVNFFNDPDHYAVYRLLPTVITAVENLNSD